MRTVNDAGEQLIKSFEQLRLTAYDDKRPDYVLQPNDKVLGTLTIGWGHTGPDVHIGMTITPEQAETLFQADIQAAETSVGNRVTVSLNDDQFASLVSFVFNVGDTEFANSTLLKVLNTDQFAQVPAQMRRWVYSKGVYEAGLERRRAAEIELFLRPVAPYAPAPKPEQQPARSVAQTKTAQGIAAAGGGAVLQQVGQMVKDSAGAHQWLMYAGLVILVCGLVFAFYGRWDAMRKQQ